MVQLLHGDCLELLKAIPDKSVDLVLTDPPYGTTGCKWDSIIPFDQMWSELKRVRKFLSPVVLFGAEPFSSMLRLSNLAEFKYDWIWQKTKVSGFVNAKLKPMNNHEVISVFSEGKTSNGNKHNMAYKPQGLVKIDKLVKKGKASAHGENDYFRQSHYDHIQEYTNYPKTVLQFASSGKTVHPTQKPVALLEYLVNTYTTEGATVLDFTMGSGSTGVACINTKRNFIGIEKDDNYFQIAKSRIENK